MQNHIMYAIIDFLWITIVCPLTAFLAYGWYSLELFAIWHYVVMFLLCFPSILAPWFLADFGHHIQECIKHYKFSKRLRSITRY